MPPVPSMLITALWIAWLVYWGVASFGVHAVRRQETISSGLSHKVPLMIGVALLAWPRFSPGWLHGRVLPRAPLIDWIGLALVAAGIVFSIWARRHLAGFWSSNVTLKQDHQLIRSGPYRYARHPIYTGLLLALLGTAISIGEWRGFLAVLLIAVAFLHKISIEEGFLTEAFPSDYPRYRAEVAALIPFLY